MELGAISRMTLACLTKSAPSRKSKVDTGPSGAINELGIT